MPLMKTVQKTVKEVSEPHRVYDDETESVLVTFTDGAQARFADNEFGFPRAGDNLRVFEPEAVRVFS